MKKSKNNLILTKGKKMSINQNNLSKYL